MMALRFGIPAVLVLAVIPSKGEVADYEAWDRALARHVSPGARAGIDINVVDYRGLANDTDFATFVSSLAAASVSSLDENATYALWSNAYNALAMKMVIDNPCLPNATTCAPIRSIKDIGTPLKPVWKKPAGVIGGKVYSLDDIEGFLRNPAPRFHEDCRVHGCIVCASISCPDVRRQAYRPATIDEQMSANVASWIQNPRKGSVLDKSTNTLTVSPIFMWFAQDFKACSGGSVLDFILPYLTADVAKFVMANREAIKLAYFDYDWDVNGPVPCECDA